MPDGSQRHALEQDPEKCRCLRHAAMHKPAL